MLYIEELKDNVLHLDKAEELYYNFTVVSKKENGRTIPFYLEYVSDDNINVKIVYGANLLINVNPSLVLKEERITLKNTDGEYFLIDIVPNDYYVMEKTYSFKITSKKILEDGSLKLKIFSKVNGMEIGWECTYDGKPMKYEITPFNSDSGEHVIIKPMVTILNEFDAIIEFTQKESGKTIKISLKNTPQKGITDYIYITNNEK